MTNKEKYFTENEVNEFLINLTDSYIKFQCDSIAIVAADIIRTLKIPKGKLEFKTMDIDDEPFGHIIRIILVDMENRVDALDIGSIALPHMDEEMIDSVTKNIALKIDKKMKKIILGDGAKRVKTTIAVEEGIELKNKTYMN